ncbi:NmrA-like family protein [Colletotrichum scovillei]|uniref:NmrA-like family protein n=1 Tax=Colletotrichum scovillei TaxID=1209932 RepID=A0A9P7QUY4_9PEZI|nr:NmrA-like family protein [Colletotrichum scovillei]KAF4774655.1 NmrA-like family protein [Colletotrichum scovillei]KAG7039740.1 NmrA-like family protein [Colletotrichum scovillei]KAG7041956.1 NmrA-like family protein [Colletotrichum scovillei]KAG7061987.1 NmrA-like family protein [Colletotrichum scovillei]
MAPKSVLLVGANGTLGAKILDSLVAAKSFKLSALKRAGSKSTIAYPADQVQVIEIDNDLSYEGLKKAFTGQEVVIVSFRLRDLDQHLRIAEAASAAGVKHFMPADFGSIDADNPRARELIPLYRWKRAVRQKAQELADKNPDFAWTGIVCGHFFDWGVKEGFLHAYLDTKKIDVIDGGDIKASVATLPRVGEAVVRILNLGVTEVTKNKTLFIQSFCITQNELLQSLEKATGAKWTVNKVKSESFIAEHKVKADAGDAEAIEDLVFAVGQLDANWTKRDDFAMKSLGLEDEDLDTVIADVVANPAV